MLEPLLRHATMPVDLQDWEGYTGDDKDSFARFRLPPPLRAVAKLLQPRCGSPRQSLHGTSGIQGRRWLAR